MSASNGATSDQRGGTAGLSITGSQWGSAIAAAFKKVAQRKFLQFTHHIKCPRTIQPVNQTAVIYHFIVIGGLLLQFGKCGQTFSFSQAGYILSDLTSLSQLLYYGFFDGVISPFRVSIRSDRSKTPESSQIHAISDCGRSCPNRPGLPGGLPVQRVGFCPSDSTHRVSSSLGRRL
jgi:hypothetical protein